MNVLEKFYKGLKENLDFMQSGDLYELIEPFDEDRNK